jgi:PDZ domain-containing protein/peptidase M48-like protein
MIALLALLGALLVSPALANESTLRPDDLRVASIGYRLAIAGRELCPKQGPVTGLLLHHLAEYEQGDRPGLVARGLDRGPGVLAVVAGSPADAAGLRAGDILLAVNGTAFPAPATIAANADSAVWRPMVEASETMLQDQLARGPAALTVLRGGETLSFTLAARTGCLLRIRLAHSSQRTAVAAGDYVIISSGLLSVARNDDELAFTIAHELAHVVLGHGAWLRAQHVPHGMMRGFGRNGERVRETEAEADRLGGEIAIAAHYDLARGAEILNRLPPDLGFGIFKTHDSDADRVRMLRALAASHSAPGP